MLKHEESAHYSDLDGMRGVLACVVMVVHFGLTTLIARVTSGMVQSGAWGLSVDFFFILSGFVLSKSFERNKQSVHEYLIKRIGRLGPVFYISTLFMLVLNFKATSISTMAANFTIIQSFLYYPSINFPSWSIPFEFFLPLIPSLFWANFAHCAKKVFVVALCGGIASTVLHAMNTDLPLLRAASGLGAGFSLSLLGTMTRRFSPGKIVTLCLFACVLLIMALGEKWPYLVILFYPVAILTILGGAEAKSIFSTRPFQALGRWSYSIYMLHVPVFSSAIFIFGAESMKGNFAIKGLCVFITIFSAAYMYLWVEKPILMWASVRAAAYRRGPYLENESPLRSPLSM
jgi:peptidoglycan/LPS O-acetylase OafA/YrhL